jgi:hypothetical protein
MKEFAARKFVHSLAHSAHYANRGCRAALLLAATRAFLSVRVVVVFTQWKFLFENFLLDRRALSVQCTDTFIKDFIETDFISLFKCCWAAAARDGACATRETPTNFSRSFVCRCGNRSHGNSFTKCTFTCSLSQFHFPFPPPHSIEACSR